MVVFVDEAVDGVAIRLKSEDIALDLASELSNVSRVCKVMGYSRQQFYEIRRNFQTYGAEGMIDRLPGTSNSFTTESRF